MSIYSKQIYLHNIDKVWQYTKGASIISAVIDTGCYYENTSLKEAVIEGRGFNLPYEPSDYYNDSRYHGTNVCSIIASRPIDIFGVTVVGVAPESKLLVLKIKTDDGSTIMQPGGTPVVAAIDYAINWKGQNGEQVRVINISQSTGDYPELRAIIERAREAGILIVCAAGNDGDGKASTEEKIYPSAYANEYDNVICVGALNPNGTISSISNSNNAVTCVVLGEQVECTYKDGFVVQARGTSMSAPIVTGILTLIIAGLEKTYGRRMTIQEIKAELIKRCKDIGVDKRLQGNGMIDMSLYLEDFTKTPAPVDPVEPEPPNPEPEPDDPISPTPNPRENTIKTLIIWFGDADLFYAKALYDFVGGYLCSEDEYKKNPVDFDICYKVGGTWIPEGNVIMLSGLNRKGTLKELLENITK